LAGKLKGTMRVPLDHDCLRVVKMAPKSERFGVSFTDGCAITTRSEPQAGRTNIEAVAVPDKARKTRRFICGSEYLDIVCLLSWPTLDAATVLPWTGALGSF